jgi:hypothetical protein
VSEDGALELSQGDESELLAARSLDQPSVAGAVTGLGATDLELVAAARASNGRPATAHERVVELILGLAALALNVHRSIARCAATGDLVARRATRARSDGLWSGKER